MSADVFILLAKAAGVGLVLAVPVGPMALLCLRRSLTLGAAAGLVTGVGIATADCIYATVAAFGLGAAASLIKEISWLPAVGGLTLILLGATDIARADRPASPPSLASNLGAYVGAVLLTLTNPATVLTFAAVIVGLGLIPDLATPFYGAIFIAGVFLGSAGWWVLVSTVGGRLGYHLQPGAIRWTRRVAGGAFIAFGLYAIIS